MQEQVLNNKTAVVNFTEIVGLLKELIATPSYSKEEGKTASILEFFLKKNGVEVNRYLNNIWARSKYYSNDKPTILLNSHHDTVKPNRQYTLNPFEPSEIDGKLFGLGSNDAGGSLVSLLATFLHYYECDNLNYNLIFAASAEEEISGNNGIEALLPLLGDIKFGIVGEPTQMQMAVAEKGLLVLDCSSIGKAGHAGREEGENAIVKAWQDIYWFNNHKFEKVSELLGLVKMNVTIIETENKSHNIIPSLCNFVVDIRVNELYTFEEILKVISENVSCNVKPRSLRMRSSNIPLNHPIIRSGLSTNRTYYGSPTISDKALMNFPTLKMGPGDSARSHTADEFIYLHEIKEGINIYIKILENVLLNN